jgi:hypothetical protein
MNNEFKAKQFKDTTVYTLESATSGGTSAGAVASNSVAIGGVQQRRSKDSIIVQDYEKKIEPTKPRNFVAKNAKMGGAGQHKDKKKAEKQGDVKHKNKQVSIDEDHSTIGMNGKPFGFHSYATAGKNTSRWSGQGQDDSVYETPIEMDPSDPMNPMIYGHGVNPATLKYRMMRATGQLKDLAQRAQTASAVEWEMIAKQFDELTMNIEQIRHGIDELAKKRKKGGIGSRGIDAHIGEEVDEGWKSALGGAALAGAMALGGGARAQSSGEDFLPDIVAHVTFKVNGNTVTKDINLGTSFKSPGDASAALEKFLKSKGIKFYEFSLERVSEKEYNNNYLDKAPASDTGASGSMDSGPYSSTVSSSSDYMAKEGVAEGGIPQPGTSSGAPKQFGPDAKIQTRQMTVKQLISTVPGLPYYNNVVDDWDAKDYSWGVTKKVIEYATYLKEHPESLAQLPPILVLNGKFEDGAHRVSAIWLLQQRMDPKNSLWANAKLNVQFVKQGVAEGLESDQRARLDDLIDTYRTATDPSYDGYGVDDHYDPDEVLDQIRREFGDRVADQIESGTDKMHFPRKDHDQGYDPMSWRKPIDRQTKAGKMYKQDSDYRKNTIKSRYRLSGKSATEGVAEAVDIGQEWMSDTELDQYVPDRLQQQWRELLGYDQNGNPSALWANLTGGYEPDVNDPQHRALMVKVANKWFAAKKIPNVKFFDVKDADDELEWLVQIGQQGVAEEWSQKYKSSINCSHPKGFSQKAHCAGKKKHTESMMTMEATCPDCGMCQTHGNLNEIKKGAKDSNGFTKCWPGHHAAGTKKGKNGGQVRNCVPNEGVVEGLLDYTRRQQLIQYLAKKLDWEVNYLELASDPELIKWYKAAQAGKDPMKAEHADPYIESLCTQLSEKIHANAPVSAYIDDFMKAAKTPNAKGHHQFKNKSAEKIRQMAVAASYSAKNPSKKKK